MSRPKIDPAVRRENDRLYHQKYYAEHREELIAYQKEYRAKYLDEEKAKQYRRTWYLKHRDEILRKYHEGKNQSED